MINLATFVFCAVTASNQLFAGVPPAAGLPVIKILGTKPKPTVTPVLEATMFFPAHLAWTKNPDFMANDLFFAAMHAFEERIEVNADLIGVLNDLEEASMKGHYKPFHLLILNDSAVRRESLYGYALLDGKSNEGLAYRAGNLKEFLAVAQHLDDIVAPFTKEGKEELKFLDKDFKVFFSLAEPKLGVIPPAKAPTGAGKSARAISAASNARAEASRKRFNPTEAVPNFFENLAKNCEEAIQEIGFILHSASHRIRHREGAFGNTPFPWDGFTFLTPGVVNSYNTASQDLAAFWSDFLIWTASSLWNAQPDDHNGGRVPVNQRIDNFLALSKCETSKDLLAMTPYVTETWTYFTNNPTFMEALADRNPNPIAYQQSLRTVSSALRQFILTLFRGINSRGLPNNLLTENESIEARKLVQKVVGAFAFAQHALAALVLIEKTHIVNPEFTAAVEKALQTYGTALKSFARRTMTACDAQIELLENRPQLQKVFLLLKQLLLPFYQTGATPKAILTFVTNLKAHMALLRPFFRVQNTFFSQGGRDNIDGWVQWARESLPLVPQGSYAYLSSNINAIENYCTGAAQDNAQGFLRVIAQRHPGQFTQTLEAFNRITTLSGGFDKGVNAVFDEIHTGITSVLIDEVNYLIHKLYLLPAEYHTVIKRYESARDYAAVPTITREIALARMKLYQYIAENHTSIAGVPVIKEQDAALVELKGHIQEVIDSLEDEGVFTNDDIVNMNIGGERGADDPRGHDHPGDTPIPNMDQLRMNDIIATIGDDNIANITVGHRQSLIQAVTPLLAREMRVIRHALLRHNATPPQRPAPFHRRPAA